MTKQIDDEISWNGGRYSLRSRPLHDYFERLGPDGVPQFRTSHYLSRGYVAHWEIEDGTLYLTALHGDLAKGPPQATLATLFPKATGKVEAVWYSGELWIPMGMPVPEPWYDISADQREDDIVMFVVAGKVVCSGSSDFRTRKIQEYRTKGLLKDGSLTSAEDAAAWLQYEEDLGATRATREANEVDVRPQWQVRPPVRVDLNPERILANTRVGELVRGQAAITRSLERLDADLREKLEQANRSALVIDRLDEDVRRLRKREDERKLEPALLSVISLIDSLGGIIADGARADGVVPRLDVLRSQALEAIRRHGVEDFKPAAGEKFDAAQHEVVNVVPGAGPADNSTIKQAERPGFRYAGRVLRPAGVTVFRFEQESSTVM